MLGKIKKLTGLKRDQILKAFDDLHGMPELSTQEFKTSAYIAKVLKDNGLEVVTGIGGTGLVAYIRGKEPGPVLGIRADMDALNHVIDGKTVAIHSCGHDAHSTMVLFAGLIAKELGIVKKGALKLIFQPSEEREDTSGARAMIQDGVLEDMDMCVGIHLRPKAEGRLGQASSALKHGALTTIIAKIYGEAAHGARPHMGKNVVDAIAAIVNAVNAIWVNPTVPSSAKVTSVQAGWANIASIPERGDIGLDLRAETNEVMEELVDKVKNAINTGASTVGCRAEIERVPGYPAAIFNDEMMGIAAQSITEILGDKGLLGLQRSVGAEDFHMFAQAKPELKTTYIGLGCDLEPGLHHPDMHFAKEALLDGVNILVNMAYKILG